MIVSGVEYRMMMRAPTLTMKTSRIIRYATGTSSIASPSSGSTKFGSYQRISAPGVTSTTPLAVPSTIARPSYVPVNFFTRREDEALVIEDDDSEGYHGEVGEAALEKLRLAGRIQLGSEDEHSVRRSAKLAAEVLREAGRLVSPGMTTAELDERIHHLMIAKGAYPSTLGYSGFNKSCTTSINNIIAHGIPDDRPLHPKDLINIDITIYHSSHHGDTSATFALPECDKPGRDLVDATREALYEGIKVCKPGAHFKEIGKAISAFASTHGYSVNEQLSGHGIGRKFHTPPWILHHRNDEPGVMEPGHCFTIEPALVQGSRSRGHMWEDGWTIATDSHARSAQFEHQVLITEDGVDILTKIDDTII